MLSYCSFALVDFVNKVFVVKNLVVKAWFCF